MDNVERKSIIEYIGEPAYLEQLAEECCELGQAALKLARILRKENPTPVTEEEARANLTEEFTDVILCANGLGLETDKQTYVSKYNRFYERMDKFDATK